MVGETSETYCVLQGCRRVTRTAQEKTGDRRLTSRRSSVHYRSIVDEYEYPLQVLLALYSATNTSLTCAKGTHALLPDGPCIPTTITR